jgi:ADP-ribose pyrophosphatase
MNSSDEPFRGRYLGIRIKDGWEYTYRTNVNGVVVIIALTAEHELLLVEQYRIPVRSQVIELPAGLSGDHGDAGEPLRLAALRELLEETGYAAAEMHQLVCCPTSSGMTDEQITFFLASGLSRQGPGGGDSSEDIIVHQVPLSEVDDWLAQAYREGKQFDPKIYTALYWLERLQRSKTLF